MNKFSKMGQARAKSLTPEQRSAIAKKAADERWSSSAPVAINEGPLKLGGLELSCFVLPNETRVISQASFLKAIGRSRSFRGGTGVMSTADKIPFFLQNSAFRPYLSDVEAMPVKPIFFKTKSGRSAVGYDALLLPRVAELYLKLRDDLSRGGGSIPIRHRVYIKAADILIRGLADVGVIALVDEATGYQKDRAKDALAKILEEFIAKELRPWVKTFPNEFYEQMFRLRGLTFSSVTKKPQYFGHLTNDVIYARLAPSVLQELKKMTPKDSRGRLKHHLHRRLTEDVGHPKLREHLSAVVALMKVSPDYKSFEKYLNQVYPKYSDNLQLPLGDRNPLLPPV